MTTSERRVLELALIGLQSEQRRLDAELDDIRRRLSGASTAIAHSRLQKRTMSSERTAPNKGRKMTAAQRRKISQAMKARWAGLKRGKAA